MQLIRQTFLAWRHDRASVLAAALAYYTVLSLPPILLLAVSVGDLFFRDQRVRDELVRQMEYLIGTSGSSIVQTILTSAQQSGYTLTATLVGIFLLFFGASGVMVELQHALNVIWKVEPKPGKFIHRFFFRRLLSVALVLALGFLLVVSLILTTVASFLSETLVAVFPIASIALPYVSGGVSFILLFLLFAMLFKFLPDVLIAWKDVWVGAALTAVLFLLGKTLIGLYLGSALLFSAYGVAGSVILFLVWIYYSTQVLLIGGELTKAYADLYGSRILPSEGAHSLEPVHGYFHRVRLHLSLHLQKFVEWIQKLFR